ncbi:CGNR zinc finger domain-containing protein [Kribbella sp. NPDC056345]|uniref:CGNR zinc finger domain-containing protein n=1 Tax=Kribbella sp. NPDC056345 TaxID=3345789 RepID=UPI0035D8DC50
MTTWIDEHFIAGDVALDFANTVFRRTPERGSDLLDSTESLAGWFAHAGLPAGGTLAEARELRSLFWQIFDAQSKGDDLPIDALGNLLLTCRSDAVKVDADGIPSALTSAGALPALALHGLRLALKPPSRPVRTCDRCGWFFLDTSRGRRRRWCSMQTCGNQAKAERYRTNH